MTSIAPLYLNNFVSRNFFHYFPLKRAVFAETKQLNKTLSSLESVAFATFPSIRKTQSNEALAHERFKIIQNIQSSSYEGKSISIWLKKAAQQIDKARGQFLYDHEKKEIDLLEQQHLALSYRSGAETKCYNTSDGQALAQRVLPFIKSYIANPKIFPGRYSPGHGNDEVQLTETEMKHLVHACTRYPKLFIKFIDRHESGNAFDEWTAKFVKWCIRSKCSIGVFVKTPNERDIISQTHLDKRSGAIDGKKGICFSDVGTFGCFKRTLCMKMDGALHPIQGDFKKREVTLKNLVNPLSSGITLKVEEIFSSFAKKTSSYQQVEYMQGGVRNWNAIHLGSMNGKTRTLDTISSDSILRELKSKAPLISFDEDQIKERYEQSGFIPLKEGQWAIALRASRLKPNLNMLEAHGYIELVCKENGRYFALPMGVQPVHLPEKALAKLFFLTATNKAGVHYPDESFYLSQRQQLGLFFPLSEQEEVRLQYTIASMQKNSEENHLLFQFAGKNCAFHIQRIFDQVIAAPFYEKIQDIADRAFSEGNFLSEAIDRITFKRAFEGLNHELLNTTLNRIVDHLWTKHREEELRQLCALSTSLLSKVHQRNINIDSQKIQTSNPRCKQAIQALLKETIETIRFYRMDLFRIETDQGILSSLNKIIKLIPSRLFKRLLTNVFLFLIGSWRWMIVKKDTVIPTKKTESDLQISSTAGNPLIQEGYLNHPAALWEWLESKDSRMTKINQILAVFQTL